MKENTVLNEKQTLMTKAMLKSKQGIAFSLEMLLVIGVVAVVLYLVVSNMAAGGKKLDVSTASTQITQMAQDTKKLFRKQGTYTGITAEVLINNRVVPDDMIVGTNIIDKWNGTLAIATPTTDTFSLTLPLVPKEVCSDFVTSVQGTFQAINVAGKAVKTLTDPVSPVTLGTQCAAGTLSTVSIVLTAGRN